MFQWLEELCGIQPSPFFFFSLLAILLVTLLYTLRGTRSQNNKLKLPPSPSKLPIIGNLHQLGTLPHRSLCSLAKKYGPLMLLHLGQVPTLIVSSADAAKEIMKTQDTNFSNRPRVRFAERLLYSNKDLGFSPYGEYWRQMRKVVVLQLLSAHRVQSFRAIREEEAHLMIETICQSCSPTSCVMNLSEIMFSYTSNVVCRAALGRKFGPDEGSKKFWKMISELLFFIGIFNVADFIPWLSFVNNINGFNARVEKNFKDFDCFLESVIEEHIEPKKTKNHGGENVMDFVDVLLGIKNDSAIGVTLCRDSIKALILDVFAAGAETTSTTLVWAMTELIRHPKIMKEVQNEIREIANEKLHITEDDLGQMHYLKMVIKETLRVHPPGPFLVPRESIQDTKVLGYDIPAKTRIIINAWAIARDPTLWDKPEEFQPKRFLNESIDYKDQNFKSIPFGEGRRGCPGMLFATPNMELPLANLLYHFNWSLPDGVTTRDVNIDETMGTVCQKKSPLLLVPTPHCL